MGNVHREGQLTKTERDALCDAGNADGFHSHSEGIDVKSGTVSITENSTASITFVTVFSNTPVVTANVQDINGENNNVQVDAVSTTEVTLNLDKVGGGAASTYTVGWMATDVSNS